MKFIKKYRKGKPITTNGATYIPNIYNSEFLKQAADKLKEFVRGVKNQIFTEEEIDWDPESWLNLRVAKPDGTKYTQEDIEIFKSHIPEYRQIEESTKRNGTWLKMPDGSTWKGDPRAWVMMQSKAFKANYSQQPWYTGQAEWETKYDYGNGEQETNNVTRAPYYNGQMWFSDTKGYGDVFAHVIDSDGLKPRRRRYKERDIVGHNFLSAIPIHGNYRHLQGPEDDTPDWWEALPFQLNNNAIERVSNEASGMGFTRHSRAYKKPGEQKGVKTDDIANWSKDLGDEGLFMYKVDDGPNKIKYIDEDPIMLYDDNRRFINEFISQPGFTDKVKFIEGNNGNFDINDPYKYSFKDNHQDFNQQT